MKLKLTILSFMMLCLPALAQYRPFPGWTNVPPFETKYYNAAGDEECGLNTNVVRRVEYYNLGTYAHATVEWWWYGEWQAPYGYDSKVFDIPNTRRDSKESFPINMVWSGRIPTQ